MNQEEELQHLRMAEQIRAALTGIECAQREFGQRLAAMQPQIDNIEAQVEKTNGRVTALELWRAKNAGVTAAIGAGVAVLGWLINWATGLIKN